MPNASEFVSNPESFLKNNLFLPFFNAGQAGYHVPEVKTFYLSEDGLTAARKGTGIVSRLKTKDVRVWSIYPTNKNGGDPLDAYWLPYERDKVYPCYLENGASVMFTALMDGCSFSSVNYDNGVTLALHANIQDDDGATDEAKMRQLLRGNGKSLHKSDYMGRAANFNENIKVSMVGVRKDGKWSMYAQRFEDRAGDYKLLGVKKV